MVSRILVTGAAGFIGYHLSTRLVADGHNVVGIDNLNDYYDPALKKARLERLLPQPGFKFERLEIADRPAMADFFERHMFDAIVHLAAQAGVRYSIVNPAAYVDSNLVGFGNVLEGARSQKCGHLVFASSSSVYGMNVDVPFSTAHNVDHPVSLYAATKKANELMAHSYAHLFGLPVTGLRFFTVYGPWGRPDMAYYSFARDILEGRPIKVFNRGNLARDFTYIDDIVETIVRLVPLSPTANFGWGLGQRTPATSSAPYRLYNIGRSAPVRLMDFIETLEKALGREASKQFVDMQPGDVYETYADVSDLELTVQFVPAIDLKTGIGRFVQWFKEYQLATPAS